MGDGDADADEGGSVIHAEGEVRVDALKEFIVLARTLNFSKAAVALGLTQPALSKHIQALEERLGFTVVHRGKPLRLTEPGRELLAYAQQVVNLYEEGVGRCRDLVRSAGPVRLLWLDYPHFGPFLDSVRDVDFDISTPRGDETFFSELLSDRIDVVATGDVRLSPQLAQEARDAGIEVCGAGERRLYIAVSNDDELARKEDVAREDLRGREVLLVNGALFTETSRLFEGFFGPDLGLRFTLQPLNANYSNLHRLNLGSSVFVCHDDAVIPNLSTRSDVKVIDRLDGEPLSIPLCALWMPGNPNPHVRAFMGQLAEWFA